MLKMYAQNTEKSCHFDGSAANDGTTGAVTPTVHRRTKCMIYKSSINHDKTIHIWRGHVGPGHALIKDLKLCNDRAAFMFTSSVFRHVCRNTETNAGCMWAFLVGCINLYLNI